MGAILSLYLDFFLPKDIFACNLTCILFFDVCSAVLPGGAGSRTQILDYVNAFLLKWMLQELVSCVRGNDR